MKTSELKGTALDYAVAKCQEGWNTKGFVYFNFESGQPRIVLADGSTFYPSSEWAHGGPIIEQEDIYLMPGCGTLAHIGAWDARIDDPEGEPWQSVGPTPLIAAMRCYVASKLGDDVEIPEALK